MSRARGETAFDRLYEDYFHFPLNFRTVALGDLDDYKHKAVFLVSK